MHPRGVVHTPFSGAELLSQARLGGCRPDRLRAARPRAVLYDQEAVLNAAARLCSGRRWFATDSPVEQEGFELSVPLAEGEHRKVGRAVSNSVASVRGISARVAPAAVPRRGWGQAGRRLLISRRPRTRRVFGTMFTMLLGPRHSQSSAGQRCPRVRLAGIERPDREAQAISAPSDESDKVWNGGWTLDRLNIVEIRLSDYAASRRRPGALRFSGTTGN